MKRRTFEQLGRSKKRLLIDTNILLLYVVGSLGLERISRHKRTAKFTIQDFRLLQEVLREFGGIVATPNVLTEVSDLLGQTDKVTRAKLLAVFGGRVIPDTEELYVQSRMAVEMIEFLRLGLTDATILSLPKTDLTVLTDDLHLYLALQRRGISAVNFNHLRETGWRQ